MLETVENKQDSIRHLAQLNRMENVVKLLRFAMCLEALTIPPYLTAFWSIKNAPTTSDNQEAKDIIHSVAMEEMLHMMSVGNIIASLGFSPVFYNECHTLKKWGKDIFPIINKPVDLAPFSKEQVAVFLEIEKPTKEVILPIKKVHTLLEANEMQLSDSSYIEKIKNIINKVSEALEIDLTDLALLLENATNEELDILLIVLAEVRQEILNHTIPSGEKENIKRYLNEILALQLELELHFDIDREIAASPSLGLADKDNMTIGAFYNLVIEELEKLDDAYFTNKRFAQLDFSHDPRVGTIEQRTITSFIVNTKQKAIDLLKWVIDQGEGNRENNDNPMDGDGALAHYYRFKQITSGYKIKQDKEGKFYFDKKSPFEVDTEYVRQFEKNNFNLSNPDASRLQDNFNTSYWRMFKELQSFYLTGERRYIMQSFDYMMKMSTNAEILMDQKTCPSFTFNPL